MNENASQANFSLPLSESIKDMESGFICTFATSDPAAMLKNLTDIVSKGRAD